LGAGEEERVKKENEKGAIIVRIVLAEKRTVFTCDQVVLIVMLRNKALP
jgi:hypothetical protein